MLQKNIDIEQGIFCIKGKGGKERYLQIGTEEVLVQLKEYKRHWVKRRGESYGIEIFAAVESICHSAFFASSKRAT